MSGGFGPDELVHTGKHEMDAELEEQSAEIDAPAPSPHCNAIHEESGAKCHLVADPHGPRHQAWAHFPGQLVTWPARPIPPDKG